MKLTRFNYQLTVSAYYHSLHAFFPVFLSLKAIRPIFRLRAFICTQSW